MLVSLISKTSKPSESFARLCDALKSEITTLTYGVALPKLEQYKAFQQMGLPQPKFTQSKEEAQAWLDSGKTVVCRTLKTGQCGSGIVAVEPGGTLTDAHIFTEYVKKLREFRVNFFKDTFVSIREKKLQGKTSHRIRSSCNGYVTTHPSAMPTDLEQRIKELAAKAASVSPSDFRGVDLIYNKFQDKLYVLEVNGGPSIEGSSVGLFVKAIKENLQ